MKATEIAGIAISHPDKIIFPKLGITKLQMVEYYEKVADKMLPYLKIRPLTLHRFPDGISGEGFYQKSAGDYFPSFIKRVEIKTEEGSNTQVICNNKKSLIYLANQGTVEFHIWLSKADNITKPDRVVFDLDPSGTDFKKVKDAAQYVREFLLKKGEEPQLMTTGQHGLHVWYTKRRTKIFDELRADVKEMAHKMEEKYPNLLTTAVRKDKREGKLFLDYLRNAYAQTSVCPYSLRSNEEAGIAMPISWNKLDDLKNATAYNFKNFKP